MALPARKEVTAEYSHMSGPCLFAGAGHRTSGMYVAPADRFTTTSSLFFETPRAANLVRKAVAALLDTRVLVGGFVLVTQHAFADVSMGR